MWLDTVEALAITDTHTKHKKLHSTEYTDMTYSSREFSDHAVPRSVPVHCPVLSISDKRDLVAEADYLRQMLQQVWYEPYEVDLAIFIKYTRQEWVRL